MVRVRADYGGFAAVADCYCGHDTLAGLATAVRGFPASPMDRREFALGAVDPGYAGGGAMLRLGCADALGHVLVRVVLQTGGTEGGAEPDSAAFSFPVDAAAIDEFVAELGRMPMALGAMATLRSAT